VSVHLLTMQISKERAIISAVIIVKIDFEVI